MRRVATALSPSLAEDGSSARGAVRKIARRVAGVLAAVTLPALLAVPAEAQAIKPDIKDPGRDAKVFVDADRIDYDSKGEVATASGRVVITYGPYVLIAKKVVYDRKNDALTADGQVLMREPGGNKLQADIVQLRNRFRDGFARHLRLILTNDAYLTADYARRENGTVTTYQRVTYTRCNTCVLENGTPTWQIKAREVVHDEAAGSITHKDATFELLGVPVLYLPQLTHPDPTVERASGFLIPTFQYSSEFGFGAEIPYFWNLAPNYDITFRPLITSQQGPLLRAEWRHRLANGEYSVDAGSIYQLDTNLPPPGDRHWRGFVHSEGLFRINDDWYWGWDGTATSDDTFMRRYKIDKRTDLVSQIYLTGLSDRNYFSAWGYHVRGLLSTDDSATTPYVLPYMRYSYTHDQPILGGELGLETSVYSLHRDQAVMPFPTVRQGTDTTRMVSDLHWERRMTTDLGQVVTPFAHLRGDTWLTNNVPVSAFPGDVQGSETTARVLPKAGLDVRWPFVASNDLGQHIVTPVAQFITSTDETDAHRLPNEDSISLNFDHTNLFLHDRFSGFDRYEGGTRVNTGAMYTYLAPEGASARFTLGESFHIGGENSFAFNSGLESVRSDLVAGIALQPTENFRLSYTGRFDEQTLEAMRTEIGLSADFDRLSAAVNYADLAADPAYGRLTAEQQIWASASVRVSDAWRVFGGARYDIDNSNSLSNVVGVGYECDCLSFKLYYVEDSTSDRDAAPERAIMFSVDFKTLGSTKLGAGLD
jgi:LPS-assembly protein